MHTKELVTNDLFRALITMCFDGFEMNFAKPFLGLIKFEIMPQLSLIHLLDTFLNVFFVVF